MSGKGLAEGIAEKLKNKKQEMEEERAEKAEETSESSETAEESDSMSDDMRLDIIEDGLREKYLLRLHEMDVVPLADFPDVDTDLSDNVRLYHVTEITYQNNDTVIDRLTTVFNTLNARNDSVFIIIDSDGVNADLYIGVRNNDVESDRTDFTNVLADTLKNAVRANFPGIRMEPCGTGKVREVSDRMLNVNNVSSASVKGNFRAADTGADFTQGLENLICAMQGKKYTGLILAEDVSLDTMETIRKNLQELYSKLSPYKNTHFSENPSAGGPGSKSFSEMSAKEKAKTIGNYVINIAGLAIGIAAMGPMGSLVGSMITGQLTGLLNTLAPNDKSSTAGVALNKDSMYENRRISDLLRIIDDQLKRIEEFEKYGMWDVAGYFVSDEPYTAETAAVNYKALMCGEGPAYELSAINTWKTGENDGDAMDEIRKCLSRFVHPRFIYCTNEEEDQEDAQAENQTEDQSENQTEDQAGNQTEDQSEGQAGDQDDKRCEVYINAAAGVSGKELALHLGFPRAATPGLTVSYGTGESGTEN